MTTSLSCRTYKASLQVPAPAVVEEANDDGSGEVTDQDGQVGHLDVWHGQLHKLLEQHTSRRVKWGHKGLSNSMTSLIVHILHSFAMLGSLNILTESNPILAAYKTET